ncbi:glutathione synthase [Hypoxylon trugodes]|uniref:glutathione synthase n=1 Tax=Hypoxylon trugodes TaxID=326681 RepID=UPI0021919926|nr:glutathione synthase [Hypoxylon trugodes]KAI1383730.1 glutathione synthase [Hypoxylon trugodes]
MASFTYLSEDYLEKILSELEDYQISHGSLLKIPRGWTDSELPMAIARPIGISIIPTPFPRQQFEHALNIQALFNELYMNIAEDDLWFQPIVQNLGEVDEFASKLWSIWERVRDEGELQQIRCGIFRSDYMLHGGSQDRSAAPTQLTWAGSELRQVEFNTYSCAGGVHSNIVTNMHRYIASKGIHKAARVPTNNAIRSIVEGLVCAHRAYDPPANSTRQTAILMTVQPNNANICDERPIEYALSECETPVSLYRVEFSGEILQRCNLGPNRELLFHPSFGGEAVEISVIYQRAGYDSHEYDQHGIEARYMLERSRAIKCPTILSHIAGFKKIQQELTAPGVLERFLSPSAARILRQTFMLHYPVDESEMGIRAQDIISDEQAIENYVLKPSLEGGGHNVYGKDIPIFLGTIPRSQWSRFILMEMINPPLVHGVLISPIDTHMGPVVSELGVIGACLWQRNEPLKKGLSIIRNDASGWTFKTKPPDVQEMSVVKGYGCFDCPSLS